MATTDRVHDTQVVPNPEARSKFPIVAICSCQWQAMAFTKEEAEKAAFGHRRFHGQK